jgi:hypothetical protein
LGILIGKIGAIKAVLIVEEKLKSPLFVISVKKISNKPL